MAQKDEKIGGNEVVGFIGKGMRVEGKLSFDYTVRVEGEFKGEIEAEGNLVVGEGGLVEGTVKVDTAIITGVLKGEIEAAKRVEIQFPGRIVGTVRTPNLIIGDGGVLEGSSIMLKRDENAFVYTAT